MKQRIPGLVLPNNPILTQIAKKIADPLSTETTSAIEKLLTVAYGRRTDRTKPTVVGLAAPQIGISKCIIAVDIGADGHGGLSDMRVYLNPEIVWRSDETEEWCEGCWSTSNVCGAVTRASKIKIKALQPDGKEVEETYSGYVARIFQHEIDHLSGIEFISHITDDNKLHWVEENDWTEYKIKEGWRDWPKKCPREKWEKIKGISKDRS